MRYFKRISTEDLKNKIEKALNTDSCDGDITNLNKKVSKDLSKVKFDMENVTDAEGYAFGPKKLIGYQTLDNGLTFLGVAAGGDWEIPIFFMIYWDGESLRGYIPTNGNIWNTDTKQAYGNDEEKDIANAKKRFGLDIESTESLDYSEANEKEILEDLMEHFETKDEAEGFLGASMYPPNIETIYKGLGIKPIEERIEKLCWYGSCENEGYELFSATCGLCYQMNGIGDHGEKCETLYQWAKELAEESRQWCEAEDPEALKEVTKGNWGY